jgi:hypothetical protein
MEMRLLVGDTEVSVTPGPQHHIESGGRDNLADADGPGEISPRESLYYRGEFKGIFDYNINPGSNRTPTSGQGVLGGATSWDFAYDAEDKVVMTGVVFLSRGNFQMTNMDGNVTLWAQALYSDGTESVKLSSDKLDAPGWGGQGGTLWDHFFGFEAPEGTYITGLRVWQRGGNNRSFTNLDDLVVVLEGDQEYEVAAAAEPEAGGTVTGAGSFADGSTVTVEASAAEGETFFHWTYAQAPDVIIGTQPTLSRPVHGPLSLVASFGQVGLDPADRTVDSEGGDFSVMANVATDTEWTAESMVSWITITSATEGTGSATISYTVDPYDGFGNRVGTIMIAGLTHSVNQLASPDPAFDSVVAAEDLGDGVFHSPWFGRFETSSSEDWILHAEQSWLFIGSADNPDSLYLYSAILESWVWTNQDIYPIMYEFNGERYVYLLVLPEGLGVLLFDYAADEWTAVP